MIGMHLYYGKLMYSINSIFYFTFPVCTYNRFGLFYTSSHGESIIANELQKNESGSKTRVSSYSQHLRKLFYIIWAKFSETDQYSQYLTIIV